MIKFFQIRSSFGIILRYFLYIHTMLNVIKNIFLDVQHTNVKPDKICFQ